MARIAIAGFGQETNSFTRERVDYDFFTTHRDRPPLVRGAEILDWFKTGSFPITAVIDDLREDHDLVPLVWAHGAAGGIVTTEAFERISAELLARLSEAMPCDAVYLDLHGAMVVEAFEDGEGELLRRCRAVAGPNVPIVASLDYHANLTPEMVEHSDALLIFRTYPHIDRPETGRHAARVLRQLLIDGRPKGRAFHKADYLLPITQQCTLIEPSMSLVQATQVLEDGIVSASYAAGFPLGDLHWCGPAIAVHAESQALADSVAARYAALMEACEPKFQSRLYDAQTGVAAAMALAAKAQRPVILADAQDNPGAGSSADSTDLLKALVAAKAQGAILALLWDPAAAAAAHAAGEGANLTLSLGGHSGPDGVTPFEAEFRVERLGDGNIMSTGAVSRGIQLALGPAARLSCGGVEVLVISKRTQPLDDAPFRHLGVDLRNTKILALKSSVHFRAEFESIAEEVLVVKAPALAKIDPAELPYQRLRAGVRLSPLGPQFRPKEA